MKIAYVLNTYPQPSQSFIRREIQALERQGVEVHRLVMRRSGQRLLDAADREEAARCDYILETGAARLLSAFVAEVVRAPRRTLRAVRLALQLARASGDWFKPLIYLCEAAYVAREARARGCLHLHAHFGTNAAAVAMLAAAMGAPGYSFTTHGPEEFDAPQQLSLGLKVANARFAVAISRFGSSQLRRWAAFAAWPRIEVVHCGIEPDRFATPAPLPEGPLHLVAIGRLVEQKGQMLLIEALAEAVRAVPELHLTLVGDGEMRSALEAAVDRLRLREHVTLAGWRDEAGVRDALAAAQALVMPSFAEGLPMVVMEAMAAGRPVLATWVAGTPELVVPGETGWLVPAGDPVALGEAIVQLDGVPRERLREMGRAARARALQRHDIDREAAKLRALFAEAVAEDEGESAAAGRD